MLRMQNGTSQSPFRLALGDNPCAPVRPAPGHGYVTTCPQGGGRTSPWPSVEWLDGVSNALASGLCGGGTSPLRHAGQTPAPTPTGDYRPSLRSLWPAAPVLGAEGCWRGQCQRGPGGGGVLHPCLHLVPDGDHRPVARRAQAAPRARHPAPVPPRSTPGILEAVISALQKDCAREPATRTNRRTRPSWRGLGGLAQGRKTSSRQAASRIRSTH